jgi:cyclohexyl-isocyanide hydratase
MRAAFVIFDHMTALDFVGVYDPLGRLRSVSLLPDFGWSVCALTEMVADDRGLCFVPDRVGDSLAAFDLLVVPGGHGTRALLTDAAFLAWLRTAGPVPLKASVCTGALLLGAAGFLAGKPATTHPTARPELAAYCGEVRTERVVDAGDVITAGGVTAGIDLGLHLVGRLAGEEARRRAARQMDYPHLDPGEPARSNSGPPRARTAPSRPPSSAARARPGAGPVEPTSGSPPTGL